MSKELAYYAESEYIRLIKFSATHRKLRAWENFAWFCKRDKTPSNNEGILMKITPSDATHLKPLL